MAMAGLYRRTLPSPPAIDFASSEGKKLFAEALQNGTMEGFFKLISYFQTQAEPAYCGLASLSMVLNALSIDPGRKWKGPWRWYDESMLDCCEPLEVVKEKGISFGKVVCLAHCAGVKVEAYRTNQSTIDEFRKFVLRCSTSDECHVISSYHRKVFKQTGTGHFSPIGGYHAEKDMALILDVARFKYPPHWIPLKLLWEAMNTVDEATGLYRGFMLVSKPHREPGMLYTLSCKHDSWVSIAKYLTDDIPLLVSSNDVKTVEDVISVVVKSLPSNFTDLIKWVAEVRREEDVNRSLSPEEKKRLALKEEVLRQVQETALYKHVVAFLSLPDLCCKIESKQGYEEGLAEVAARICCQGAEILCGRYCKGFRCREACIKCLKDTGDSPPVTLLSGTVVSGSTEREVDVLVPSSQMKMNCDDCDENGPFAMYPAGKDVLTVLLLALHPQTWSGIKDHNLLHEMKQLVSVASLPTLLLEEVLHLRRQLKLLKRYQENKEEEDLSALI